MSTEETSKNFPEGLFDKNGVSINEDDVIFDGKDYYRIYWNAKQPQVGAISSTYGYLHNLTQKELNLFDRIGTYAENKHFLR